MAVEWTLDIYYVFLKYSGGCTGNHHLEKHVKVVASSYILNTVVLDKTSILNVLACGSKESLEGGYIFTYVP
jgi:hypothetical protein